MCFIPRNKNSIRLKIARKDITCYKIVHKSKTWEDIVYSLIFSYTYRIGDIYGSVLGIRGTNVTEQNVIVESGFHSYRRKPDPKSISHDEFIATCTIPKGAIYDRNKNEYVSSHIIINEIMPRY